MLKTDSYCIKSEMIQNQGYGFSLSSVTSIKFHFFLSLRRFLCHLKSSKQNLSDWEKTLKFECLTTKIQWGKIYIGARQPTIKPFTVTL